MSVRRLWVQVHRYAGLGAAVFLVLIGLTGAVLAFETDYDRWLNPRLWHTTPHSSATARLAEQALVTHVEKQFGDSGQTRVEQIDIVSPQAAQEFEMTNGLRVYVDPYTGRVNGTRSGATPLERFLLGVRVVHTRLFAGERGRLVVDWISALLVLLLVPAGIYLWLNTRRWTVTWNASKKRINWDLHSTVGIYASATVLLIGATGVMLGYEAPLYWLTRSKPVESPRLPRSTPVADSPGARRVSLDSVLATADRALPESETYQVLLPMRPRSVFQVVKHASMGGKSSVAIDQYSGRVLLVDDFAHGSRAFRAHTIDQAIHLGAIGGFETRLLAMLSALALVLIVATGTLIWWQKGGP